MSKRKTLKSLLLEQQVLALLLFTVAVIFIWVVSSIYFSYSKSTLTVEDEEQILPLDPTLNTTALEELTKRKTWTPQELEQFSISVDTRSEEQIAGLAPISTPAPTQAPSPTLLPSASPVSSSSATASPSGTTAP